MLLPRSRFLTALRVTPFLMCGLAGAVSLDFGVSSAPAGGTALQDSLLRLGVQDVQIAGFGLAAGLSSRAADASLSRSLVLPGLGAARLRADGAVLYSGGLRGGLNLSGTLGPVALTLSGSGWNADPTRFDPLARWAEVAPDLRGSGAAFGLSARYRFSRDLVLNVGGNLGGQSSVLVQAELRQDALSYRLGARAGQDVLGVAAGLTYTDPDSGLSASLDGLAGPGTLGLTGRLGADNLLGDGSTLSLYAAYEPWRTTSETLRGGLQLGLPLGPGTLNLEGYGGTHRGGSSGTPNPDMQGLGFGLKVGYVLPLDGQTPDEAPAPDTQPTEAQPTDSQPGDPAPTAPPPSPKPGVSLPDPFS